MTGEEAPVLRGGTASKASPPVFDTSVAHQARTRPGQVAERTARRVTGKPIGLRAGWHLHGEYLLCGLDRDRDVHPLSRASIAIGDSQFSVWAAMASAVTPLASSRCTWGRIRSAPTTTGGGGGAVLTRAER
jgi:hypothetical protein